MVDWVLMLAECCSVMLCDRNSVVLSKLSGVHALAIVLLVFLLRVCVPMPLFALRAGGLSVGLAVSAGTRATWGATWGSTWGSRPACWAGRRFRSSGRTLPGTLIIYLSLIICNLSGYY